MTCHHLLHHSHNSGWNHAPSSVAPAAGQKTAHTYTHQQINNTSSTNHFQTSIPLLKQTTNSINHITQTGSSPDYTPSPLLPGRDTRSALHKDSEILHERKLRTLGDRCQIPSTLVAFTDLRNFQAPKKPGLKSGSPNSRNFLPTRGSATCDESVDLQDDRAGFGGECDEREADETDESTGVGC